MTKHTTSMHGSCRSVAIILIESSFDAKAHYIVWLGFSRSDAIILIETSIDAKAHCVVWLGFLK